MSKVIRISEITFKRLQKLAVPLEDTPASVIEKLLDFCDSKRAPATANEEDSEMETEVSPIQSLPRDDDSPLKMRTARQRGGIVEIDGSGIECVRFNVNSLRELYEEIMHLLDDNGLLERLRPHVPISTSPKRYLIATNKIHPNGKEFVSPAHYRGFYMESHKDWNEGIRALRTKMLMRLGLSIKYIG